MKKLIVPMLILCLGLAVGLLGERNEKGVIEWKEDIREARRQQWDGWTIVYPDVIDDAFREQLWRKVHEHFKAI